MFLLTLTACGPKPTETAVEDSDTPAGTVAISVNPSELDFGTLATGTIASAVVSLFNDGSETVTLTDVRTSAASVEAGYTFLPVASGGSLDLTLTWSPEEIGDLDAQLDVAVASGSGDEASARAQLRGSAVGAGLGLSPEELDLGLVPVGCEGFAVVTLANAGAAVRTVSRAAFRADLGFELLGADGGVLPALPWTLEPGATTQIGIGYEPREDADLSDLLILTTDDPVVPELQLPVQASARVEERASITFDAVREQNVTVLIAVNSIITTGTFAGLMSESLYYFFDTLRNAEVPFRVGFLIDTTGEVYGEIPYVDETFTPDDAVLIAKEMYEDSAGDNDYLFQTLYEGIEANREWLLDESDEWSEAMLNLVGVNNDVEQSTGNYVTWVTDYQAFKTDPADIVVHGIGGDVPRGCSGADPAQAFSDAATYTGGTFGSICAEDWSENMTELAYGCLGGRTEFVVDGTPVPWSLEVFFDDTPQPSGWVYDETISEVVFDDDAYPPLGTTVRIEYIYAPVCDDGA